MTKELTVALMLLITVCGAAFSQVPPRDELPDGSSLPLSVQSPNWYVVDYESNPVQVAVGTHEWQKLKFDIAKLEAKCNALETKVKMLEEFSKPIEFDKGFSCPTELLDTSGASIDLRTVPYKSKLDPFIEVK